MMKKIILVLVFLLIPQICFATDPMLEKFQELRYRLEAGTTFRDYNTAYQDVYIQYRKTNDEKYKELMELYTALRDIWSDYASKNYVSPWHNLFDKKFPTEGCNPRQSIIDGFDCKTIKASQKLEGKIVPTP